MIPDYSDIFNGFWPPSDRSVRRCRAAHNRDYRWSSTPDADRCAVFGIRLGQRPSEPRDRADRLRPAAIIQLPVIHCGLLVSRTVPTVVQNVSTYKRYDPPSSPATHTHYRTLA